MKQTLGCVLWHSAFVRTVPPSFSGYLIDAVLLVAPFLFAGSLKIAYAIMIFLRFRNVKPPEGRPA